MNVAKGNNEEARQIKVTPKDHFNCLATSTTQIQNDTNNIPCSMPTILFGKKIE